MRTPWAPIAVLLALSLLAFGPVPAAAADRPVLTFARGEVTAKAAGGQWAKAEKGLALASGDMVKTGARSKAEISFPSGVMRLFENTLVVIPAVSDKGGKKDIASVQLDSGSTAYRIDPAVGAGFSVKTKHVIAGVKGTSFGVTAGDKESLVVVYFGKVEVTNLSGGGAVTVGTNQTSTGTDSGPGAPVGAPTGDGFGGWSDTDSAQPADPATESQGGGADESHHGSPGFAMDVGF